MASWRDMEDWGPPEPTPSCLNCRTVLEPPAPIEDSESLWRRCPSGCGYWPADADLRPLGDLDADLHREAQADRAEDKAILRDLAAVRGDGIDAHRSQGG